MGHNAKWLYTIATKNDIPKSTVKEYMQRVHKKSSASDLTIEEMEDTLKYVSDSRLVKSEKQIYLIRKIAGEIGMGVPELNHLALKFGAAAMEELDEKGIRGMIAAVTSMVNKARKDATVCPPQLILITYSENGITTITTEVPSNGRWVMYAPRSNALYIYAEEYYQHDLDKVADEKEEAKRKVVDMPVRVTVGCGNYLWYGDALKSAEVVVYKYKKKVIGITLILK